jgi:Mitochondrial carrier protein
MQIVIPFKLIRNAGIGVAASVVSDTVVNVFRVIKTTKQSLGSKQSASYAETVKIILAADGWKGLFGRGLRTRIYANALQSIVFTIVWRGLADYWRQRTASDSAKEN